MRAAERVMRRVLDDPVQARDDADALLRTRPGIEGEVIARRALGLAVRELGDLETARTHLDHAIADADTAGLAERAGQARLTLIGVLADLGRLDDALRIADQATPVLRGPDADRLLGHRALLLCRTGRFADGLRIGDSALRRLRAADDPTFVSGLLNNRGLAHAYAGDLRRAGADLTRAARVADDAGIRHLAAMARVNLGFVAQRRGDLVEALRLYAEAEPAFADTPGRALAIDADHAATLLAAGLSQEARRVLTVMLDRLSAHPTDAAEARMTLAHAELACGRPAASAASAQIAHTAFTTQGRPGWALLAEHAQIRAQHAMYLNGRDHRPAHPSSETPRSPTTREEAPTQPAAVPGTGPENEAAPEPGTQNPPEPATTPEPGPAPEAGAVPGTGPESEAAPLPESGPGTPPGTEPGADPRNASGHTPGAGPSTASGVVCSASGWAVIGEVSDAELDAGRARLFAVARDSAEKLAAWGWRLDAAQGRIIAARLALDARDDDTAAEILAPYARPPRGGTAAERIVLWHATALHRLARGNRGGALAAVRAGLRDAAAYADALEATELRMHASVLGADLASLGLRLARETGRASTVLAWIERGRAITGRAPAVRPPADPDLAAALADLRRTGTELAEAIATERPHADALHRHHIAETRVRHLSRTAPRRLPRTSPPLAPAAPDRPTSDLPAPGYQAPNHPTAGCPAPGQSAPGRRAPAPDLADPARPAPARVDPARVDPARPAPARVAPARPAPARMDPARVDPARRTRLGVPRDALFDALGERAFPEFAVCDGTLLAVSIVRGRFRTHELGRVESAAIFAIRFAVNRLAQRYASPGRGLEAAYDDLQAVAGELDRALFPASVRRALGDRDVVLAPCGPLHGLPWAALPALAHRPCAVAASADAWLAAYRADVPGTGRTLLVAGPDVPQAASEVAGLLELRPDAEVLTGPDATTGAVAKALDGAELAHIGAHAAYRPGNALLSEVMLADGALYGHDLAALVCPPRRVVLSTCDAALGDVTAADRPLGPAAALLDGGAATVVASVAPVNDAETSAFMLNLHHHLARGRSPAHALAVIPRTPGVLGFTCLGAGT